MPALRCVPAADPAALVAHRVSVRALRLLHPPGFRTRGSPRRDLKQAHLALLSVAQGSEGWGPADQMANEWARKVGQMLRHVRPGLGALATSRLSLPGHGMVITSPAFQDGGAIPARYTQDGESLFPPLYWDNVPDHTKSLVLLVEDADAPFPRPLVHALLHAIPPGLSGIPEGGVALRQTRNSPLGFKAGRNSVSRAGWMAPSPIPGHGPHRYAFQLLAIDMVPSFASPPGRGTMLRAVRQNIIAASRLIGVYQRA